MSEQPSAGLGLGLYLAREIVTAHGGSIDAASSLGEGTVIVVRLPIGKQKADGGIGRESDPQP